MQHAPDDADHPICGDTDTQTGEPCQRDAGWGTNASRGPCRDHVQSYTVPKKLTPEVQNSLIGAAKEGAKIKHCAQLAGIGGTTLWEWLSEGEEHIEADIDSELAELYRTFHRARASGAVKRLRDANDEFVLQSSYGYTKREEHEVDMTVNMDPGEAYVAALEQGMEENENPYTTPEDQA